MMSLYEYKLPLYTFRGFPGGTNGKESACQCRGHKRSTVNPWIGKIPLRRAWQPTPYPGLENPLDRGAWQAMVHRVGKRHD